MLGPPRCTGRPGPHPRTDGAPEPRLHRCPPRCWLHAREACRLESRYPEVHTVGENMPEAWLTRFPTIRNLRRLPQARHASTHFFVRQDVTLASQLALFPQRFEHATGVYFAGFIEDVATDPATLRLGCASTLLVAAVERARNAGMPLLGLATAIPEFYERLCWGGWQVQPRSSAAAARGTPTLGSWSVSPVWTARRCSQRGRGDHHLPPLVLACAGDTMALDETPLSIEECTTVSDGGPKRTPGRPGHCSRPRGRVCVLLARNRRTPRRLP